jgi:hypothetical protein
MSKHKMEIRSVISPATVADILVNIRTLQYHVRGAVLGRPPGPRVIVTSLPKSKEIRESLSGHLLAIASDHHAYISDSIDRGDDIDLQEVLAQARAPEDLFYALMVRNDSVSIDATWSIWVVDELERLADDLGDDDDWANCEAARALAATIISCLKTQGFLHLLVRSET